MTDTLTPTESPATEASADPSGLRKVVAISASLVGTYAVTSVLGMLFWLLAARQFSIGAVGVAGAAVAMMMLLALLGTCGLGTLLIARLPATDPGQRRVLVRTALLVTAGGGALLGAVVPVVGIELLGVDQLRVIAGTPALVALFAVATGLTAVTMVVDQAVLVVGNGNLQLERNTAASTVKLLALLVLVVLGEGGGMTIFLAWTLGTALTLPVVAWRTRGGLEHDQSDRLVDLSLVRGLGGQALSHHSLNIALQVPLQLLPLLVLVGVSAAGNGVFSTSLQVTGAIFALPYAISIALFASARGSERDTADRMRLTLPLSLGISVAANVVLFPLAGFVLQLFGSQYSDQGVEVLRLLALAGLPIVVKDHYVALRRVQGRTTEATLALVGLAVFELLAAGIGVVTGGLIGLCAWWLGALVLEAAVLAVPLLRATRAARSTDRDVVALAPAPVPTHVDVTAVDDRLTPGGPADEPAPAATRLHRLVAAIGAGPAVLLMSSGLLLVCGAVTMSRDSGSGSSGVAQALYVAGLAVIFVPAILGVLLPRGTALTRAVLVVALVVLLQLTRVVVQPTRFLGHDELVHLTGLRSIEQSGRLFAENPLLPVTSYYPGIQVAADAVHDVTGLGNHTSAIAVLVAARVVMALSLVLVVGWITRSQRIGATAAVLYACNLQMLVFNASFSYQSLALPLAVFAVYLVLTRRRGARLSLVPAVLATWAVVASHHITQVLTVVAFVTWAVVELVLRRGWSRTALAPLVLAASGVAGFVVTLLNPGNPLLRYLGEIVDSSYSATSRLLGGGGSRQLFQNSAGVQSAAWEKYAILASLVITLGVLLVSLWRARTLLPARSAVVVLLLLVASIFPIIPAGHLTSATAEVGDRSAGFVFVGVAFVVAWWIWRRPMTRLRLGWLAVGATVVFIGSVVLGAGSISNQLPGPYRVSDDARSVDADSLAATRWMAANLPPDSVVYGDRVGGLLAGAYGRQFSTTHASSRVDASRLLLDPAFTADDVRLVRAAGIRYLIADRRNANGLPNQGVYVETGEFGEQDRTAPVPAEALRKFSAVPGVQAIYDNGSIVIYDLGGLDAD